MKMSGGQKIIVYILLGVVLILFIGPIVWFVLLAFRPPGDTYTIPPKVFFTPTFESFNVTFVNPGNNAMQLVNSLIIATGATLLSLPFSLAAAYALARYRMRGKRFIMMWYISQLMAPPIVFLIPYFILMTR